MHCRLRNKKVLAALVGEEDVGARECFGKDGEAMFRQARGC